MGMEAVEREVKRLSGSVRITSEMYKGSRLEIKIPYNLDIQQILGQDRVAQA